MHGFTIGAVSLKYGLFLAPMAGITDSAFRSICKEHGAEYRVSEMISAKALHYRDQKTAVLARITKEETPISLQIFGSEPDIMAEAAAMLAENAYKGCSSTTHPTAIDINMGCPVPKVAGNGEGSALMCDPQKAKAILKAVVAAVSLPVTVKIRTGWDADHQNAPEIAKMAEQAGISAIFVHGRTRSQLYAPPVDLESIRRVKEAVSVPVIGNGDIQCADDAIRMYHDTGCDGIMIGRGATGNPWIFEEIIARMEHKEYQKPTMEERIFTALEQIRRLTADKGDFIGVLEARKHLAWYTKGMSGAAVIRDKINHATTLEEMQELLLKL